MSQLPEEPKTFTGISHTNSTGSKVGLFEIGNGTFLVEFTSKEGHVTPISISVEAMNDLFGLWSTVTLERFGKP